jgi:putative selenium metabolism hydrolase
MGEMDALRRLAQEREQELVAFCRKLIQTRSMPGEEALAARAVREEMQSLGYDDVWQDEVGNVVGVLRGSGGGPSLMLNTHLDHVSAGDESGWPFPPFEGRVHEGAVWGRGAMDIKGPTAAQVHGAALLRTAGLSTPGDVYVAAAVQEEVGGLGSIELARTTRTDRAVIGEATNNELRRGHRGRIELIARIHGRSVHASMPERGINPHYSLARFVSGLEDLALSEDPFLGPETFAPTLLFTDQTSANVVPGELRLHIDWRTVPQRSPAEIRDELQRLLDASLVHGATGEVSIKEEHLRTHTGAERDVPAAFPSFVLGEEDPLLVAGRTALEEAFGREVPVRRWEFATDGGHLMAAGIPCIGFGPGDETLAHTNQERVPIAQLTEAALGYAALALRLTTPAPA